MKNLTWPYEKLALNIFIQKTNWVLRRNIQDYDFNCSKKNECPMQNKCLTPSIIHEATVINNTDIVEKIHFGLCKTYCNHARYFRLQRYSKDTELSKYVCELKTEKEIPLNKSILFKRVYNKPRFNYCTLCLMEKLYINNSIGDKKFLSKKSEFVSKCRHENKR